MYYAVIDTNVLVSALINSKGIPAKVIKYIFENKLIPIFNEEIIEEYEAVLYREKFNFAEADIIGLIAQIKINGVHKKALNSEEDFSDIDDKIFFEVTLSHLQDEDNTYLVTGNLKHFPINPFIISPKQMIEIIENP